VKRREVFDCDTCEAQGYPLDNVHVPRPPLLIVRICG